MEAKRNACESDPDCQQLTPTAKVIIIWIMNTILILFDIIRFYVKNCDNNEVFYQFKVKPHHKRPQFTLTRKGKKSSPANQPNDQNPFLGNGKLFS